MNKIFFIILNLTIINSNALYLYAKTVQPPTNSIKRQHTLNQDEDIKKFIHQLFDKATQTIKEDTTNHYKSCIFEQIFKEYFASHRIAKFIAGRQAWSDALEHEKLLFHDLLTTHLSYIYNNIFSVYKDNNILHVDKVQKIAQSSKQEWVVNSWISLDNNQRANIQWYVSMDNNKLYKVTEVLVEGRSLSNEKREDFRNIPNITQEKRIKTLIKFLKNKHKNNIHTS